MTDEMIMEAVKNGDLQRASLLFERYNKRIFNFLARMTMDREVAEDLTQNVFLRMIKYRNSYKEGSTSERKSLTTTLIKTAYS
jgi:RNA polymerase sigma-70 factor (ECF subfamily)